MHSSGTNSDINLQYYFTFLLSGQKKKKSNTGHKIKTFNNHNIVYQETLVVVVTNFVTVNNSAIKI